MIFLSDPLFRNDCSSTLIKRKYWMFLIVIWKSYTPETVCCIFRWIWVQMKILPRKSGKLRSLNWYCRSLTAYFDCTNNCRIKFKTWVVIRLGGCKFWSNLGGRLDGRMKFLTRSTRHFGLLCSKFKHPKSP